MKKTWILVAILSVAVLALGVTGTIYAQGPNPGTPDEPYPYDPRRGGYGMMSGHGMMGSGVYGEEGPMHDDMIASLAETLGLSADELEARHDAGETLWEIAETEGLNAEETQELMSSAHEDALTEAVADGWLTAEQAEWMDEHMNGMWGGPNAAGYGGHCGSFNTRDW